VVIIPARYGSTRFEGKPLALIHGQPMIAHVWRNATALGYPVYVATDDTRIADAVTALGGQALLTRPDHPCGTDRIWEAVTQLPHPPQWVLNLQGDEPQVQPHHLQPLLQARLTSTADVLTLVTPLTDKAEINNPNRVKVARSLSGRALYFSRCGIPYARHVTAQRWHHIGVYLYRFAALQTWVNLPPSPLEQTESLEQLRALEHGLTLDTVAIEYAGMGIDTPDDLHTLLQMTPAKTTP
jgi:3-deoxy-manno-octulosonate cytidylyltransferase (CMP-KDO synthetase)